MEVTNTLVGSDVEFFVKSPMGIVTAEGLVRGTKKKPFRFDPHNAFFATQLDNVLAEGNIPPANTAEEFVASLAKLRSYIDETLPNGLCTLAVGAAELSPTQLATPNAQRFGCDPSLCAWTMKMEPVVCKNALVRAAGFHVHVGYDDPKHFTNLALARAMDLHLGVPSVLMEPSSLRREAGYGMAGNMRHQKHGVEYRTLSSYFASTPGLIRWVYHNTMKAVEMVNSGKIVNLTVEDGVSIRECINKGMKSLAEALIQTWGVSIPV